MKVFLFILAAVNTVSLLVCLYDKRAAIKRRRRVPEKTLFAVSALGGAFGMLAGMLLFRHKTKHRAFVLGIPALCLLWILIIAAAFFMR